jgi:hypothetical protein
VTVPHLPQPPAPASVSLSPAARSQLWESFDPDAMDRLLNTLGPEDRARFLRAFEDAELAAAGRTDVETRDVTVTIRFGDPEGQKLLEQVWAPFWSELPAAALSDPSYPLPGRALAAVRLADSTAKGEKEGKP